MIRKLNALIALSQDRGATHAERALAALRASQLMERAGIDYVNPIGSPR